ncbi:MAG TPA: hypothetical protein VKX39_04330 [Bryobacteraceae bacterium]|jgi:hypothetical protein|nr:hypothetical protein [Bryobacteraceae bacterium]
MDRFYEFLAPLLEVGIIFSLALVLVFLIAGRFYKYWAVLAYVAWELVATLAFTIADVIFNGSSPEQQDKSAQLLYARLYWTNDVLVDLFRFVLVILLIYMVSEGSKRVSGTWLAVIVAAALVLPFMLFDRDVRVVEMGSMHFRFPATLWFQSTSELLNFGAAIMNLILWIKLLASRQRDPQILLVSLGLGIVVTGTAMAYGVRHLLGAREFKAVGYVIMNLSQLLGWLIWCRAFRPAAKTRAPVKSAVSSI